MCDNAEMKHEYTNEKKKTQTNLNTAASCDVSAEISPPETFKSD